MKFFSLFSNSFSPRFLYIKEGYRSDASLESQQEAYSSLISQTAQELNQTRDSFNPFEGESYDIVFDAGKQTLISTFLAEKFGEPITKQSWKDISLHPKTFFVLDALTDLGYTVNNPQTLQGLHIHIHPDGRVQEIRDENEQSELDLQNADVFSSNNQTTVGLTQENQNLSLDSSAERQSENRNISQDTLSPAISNNQNENIEFVSNHRCSVYRDSNGNIQSIQIDDALYEENRISRYILRNSDGRVIIVQPFSDGTCSLIDELSGHVWEIDIDGHTISDFYGVDDFTTHERAIVRTGSWGQEKLLISKYSRNPWSCRIQGVEYKKFRDILLQKNGSVAVEIQKGKWYLVDKNGQVQKAKKIGKKKFELDA